jgi:hypothetical protein
LLPAWCFQRSVRPIEACGTDRASLTKEFQSLIEITVIHHACFSQPASFHPIVPAKTPALWESCFWHSPRRRCISISNSRSRFDLKSHQEPDLCVQIIDLGLDHGHPSHLHIQFVINPRDVLIDVGEQL